MKKILVSLLFLVAAVASFAQIDSINYPARKMPFGNWDFIWTNGALTDTVKVYPEKGGIGLDTLFFGDSKQWTAWQPGTSDTGFVKTIGDSITGTLYFPGAQYSLIDSQSAKFSSSTNYYSLLNHDRLTIQNGTGQLTKLDIAGIWFVGHDFTVTDDAPFEYLRFNYGDSSTTINNILVSGSNNIVNGLNSFAHGISNIEGAEQFDICDVVLASKQIEICSDYGDISAKFHEGKAIYVENYNDNSNFLIATIDSSFFNGTSTILVTIEDVSDIDDNYNNQLVIEVDADSMNVGNSYLHGVQNRIINGTLAGHVEGTYSSVSGYAAHAEGEWTQAAGRASHSEGYNTEAIGRYSHAGGRQTMAIGDNSMSIGYNSRSIGLTSFAAGMGSYSYLDESFAMGTEAKSFAIRSFAFGIMTNANSYGSTVFGSCNDTIQSGNKNEWITTDFLFSIGNGADGDHRNNALAILKNGKTFIGDSSNTTDAILVVDPTDSTSTFIGTVSVEKSVKVGNDTEAASAANVGAIRYRSDANNSYCEMVMQTGASTYAWVIIKQNTW